MKRMEARELLIQSADVSFKEFNDRITNCTVAPSIGVRVPDIRRIAKKIIKDGWEEYLEEMEALCGPYSEKYPGQDLKQGGRETAPCGDRMLWQEEHMLQGIVAGSARMSKEERVRHLDPWVMQILSWADCDCSVSSMKFMKKDQDFWYTYTTGWLAKAGGNGTKQLQVQPFAVRFAVVALMQYYINDEYIDRVLEIFSSPYGYEVSGSLQPADEEVYYIKMAQAWALSVCFVKYRERTLHLFEKKSMDGWVQNKAIQKCRESYRVSQEDKELLKTLKF